MNALMRRSRGPRGARALGLCAAAPLVLWLACPEAEAAAIHRRGAEAGAETATAAAHIGGIPEADLATFKEWSRYLLAGPSAWAEVDHPPVTEAVRSAIWTSVRTDPGGTDPMVDYLLWKQSIDPTRFAHYHPRLAPALHRIAMARTSPVVSPPQSPTTTVSASGGGTSSPPAASTAPGSLEPQNLLPPSVPEPGMVLLAAGMTAWFVRRMHGRTLARGE